MTKIRGKSNPRNKNRQPSSLRFKPRSSLRQYQHLLHSHLVYLIHHLCQARCRYPRNCLIRRIADLHYQQQAHLHLLHCRERRASDHRHPHQCLEQQALEPQCHHRSREQRPRSRHVYHPCQCSARHPPIKPSSTKNKTPSRPTASSPTQATNHPRSS